MARGEPVGQRVRRSGDQLIGGTVRKSGDSKREVCRCATKFRQLTRFPCFPGAVRSREPLTFLTEPLRLSPLSLLTLPITFLTFRLYRLITWSVTNNLCFLNLFYWESSIVENQYIFPIPVESQDFVGGPPGPTLVTALSKRCSQVFATSRQAVGLRYSYATFIVYS